MEVSGKLNGNSLYTVNAGELDDNSIEFGGNIGFEFNQFNFNVYYNGLQGKNTNSTEFGASFNFLW